MTTSSKPRRWAVAAAGGVLLLAGCGDDDSHRRSRRRRTTDRRPSRSSTRATAATTQPEVDPADFVDVVDNPYLPARSRARWVYEGETDGETERVEVVVHRRDARDDGHHGDRRARHGVRRRRAGRGHLRLVRPGPDGNVWYLGEDTEGVRGRQGRQHRRARGRRRRRRPARHRDAAAPAGRRRVPAGVLRGRGRGHGRGHRGRRPRRGRRRRPTTTCSSTKDWNPLEPDVDRGEALRPRRRPGPRGARSPAARATIELVEFTPAG